MARLKVRLRGKTVSEIPLAEGRQYLAGRKDESDILLRNEKGISREHFRLTEAGGSWTVETLSRFGEVLLAGERVANLVLEHGMVFTVPPYEFEFLMTSADASVPTPEMPEEGQEMAAVPMALSMPPDEDDGDGKTFVGVAPSVPYIKVIDSQGDAREMIRLEGGDTYVAGRDPSCNIQIRDQRVSRRQFEIRKAGGQYTIIDLGSVNGTLLNGNPIPSTEPVSLKSGDAISVLENYLYFELHDPNFKARLEMVNLPQPVSEPFHSLVPLADHVLGDPSLPVPTGAHHSVPAPWEHGAPAAYHHPGDGAGAAPPAPTAGFDYRKHRPRLILGAVILLLGLYYFTSGDGESSKPQGLGPMVNDPLAKLTPEQRKLAADSLKLAKSYYMQGKYEIARSELVKMQEIIPAFEDSDNLMKLINEAVSVQQLQRKQEELERARAEAEDKILRKTTQCRKILGPQVTMDLMENCLVEVLPLNPNHPRIEELKFAVQEILNQKAAQDAQAMAYKDSVDKLRGIYGRAKSIDSNGRPLAAIDAYSRVVASALPDPNGLKGVSRNRIGELKKLINAKTATYQHEAEQHEKEGRLKQAILSLRKARNVDPDNPDLPEKIRKLKGRLQEQMMTLYQEGILEESFGNVEGDENKAGAKQKWQKIVDQDVSDGEYYKKAYIKLKKYGAPR